jgi:hypothetical protein
MGSGWGAVGGALVGGGFGAAAVSVWDKINDTKADIQKVESTVQEAKAGIYKDISDAARGVTQEIGGVAKDVAGVGKEILNNRFATERGLCDLGYKTNSDIRDSRDQMGAGFNRVMDRLCNMEHYQQNCCCETKGLIKEVKSDLALQLERCCCDIKNGQQEIKCLIENTAKGPGDCPFEPSGRCPERPEHYQPSGCSSEDYWRYYNGITNCHTRMIRKEYIYQGCTPFFVLTT